jgi:hypothetical protein
VADISFSDFDLNLKVSQISIRIGFIDVFTILEKYHPKPEAFKELAAIVTNYKTSVLNYQSKSLFNEYFLSLMEDLLIYRTFENNVYTISKEDIVESFLDNEQKDILNNIKKRFNNFQNSLSHRVNCYTKINSDINLSFNEDSIDFNQSGLSFSINKQLISTIISTFDSYLLKVEMDEIHKYINLYLNSQTPYYYLNTISIAALSISNQTDFIYFINLFADDFNIKD